VVVSEGWILLEFLIVVVGEVEGLLEVLIVGEVEGLLEVLIVVVSFVLSVP
jgi:hypothetical protein